MTAQLITLRRPEAHRLAHACKTYDPNTLAEFIAQATRLRRLGDNASLLELVDCVRWHPLTRQAIAAAAMQKPK